MIGKEVLIPEDLALFPFKYDKSLDKFLNSPIKLYILSQSLIYNENIPTDTRLHSFLLDKDSKIILVGNPLRNEKLWDLYKNVIENELNNIGL